MIISDESSGEVQGGPGEKVLEAGKRGDVKHDCHNGRKQKK